MLYDQYSLVEAREPQTPRYPFSISNSTEENNEDISAFENWWQAKTEKQGVDADNLDSIRSFAKMSARHILADSDDSNIVYSPINIWLYLETLATLTDGDTRLQILEALGLDSQSPMSDEARNLFNALYWDDGVSVCRPSASVWINQQTFFSEELLSKIATWHHASVFQGPIGEDAFDEAFRAWLNKQTNNLLEEFVNSLGLDRGTAIYLCASFYYRSLWSLPFNKDETFTDVFYSRKGELSVDYMIKEEGGGYLYLADHFSSIIMDLQEGGYVTIVLPNSDNDVEEVLQSEELFDFLFSGMAWSNVKKGRIRISMPRMDILMAFPMDDVLANMGIENIFNSRTIVFSDDIRSDDSLVFSSAGQYSRLIMNEDGVEAASIIVSDSTVFHIPGEENIDFVLNRPFLFVVFSETNIPLYIGVFKSP